MIKYLIRRCEAKLKGLNNTYVHDWGDNDVCQETYAIIDKFSTLPKNQVMEQIVGLSAFHIAVMNELADEDNLDEFASVMRKTGLFQAYSILTALRNKQFIDVDSAYEFTKDLSEHKERLLNIGLHPEFLSEVNDSLVRKQMYRYISSRPEIVSPVEAYTTAESMSEEKLNEVNDNIDVLSGVFDKGALYNHKVDNNFMDNLRLEFRTQVLSGSIDMLAELAQKVVEFIGPSEMNYMLNINSRYTASKFLQNHPIRSKEKASCLIGNTAPEISQVKNGCHL
tara:strand:- start:2907 stop:3749 length:843 start_codon:yes stop_codon:yes gene_type:complete